MITYTWNIFRLDCAPVENGLTDVVKIINWVYTGQDENGTSASMSNSYPLPSPTPESFTDYSTLTEETVISWLEGNLDVGYLQTYLANEIASQYNPPITPLPLPWIKAEPLIEVGKQILTGNEDFVGGGLSLGSLYGEDSIQRSTASGSNAQANGANSIASGTNANAANAGAIATGESSTASGIDSQASGSNAQASGDNSIASGTLEVMIAGGYKPNATDGDSDGMVQDSTKWERPIDSEL